VVVLVIATTGLIYELVMAAVASYVLGDSVTQFSLVIGAYLSALGIGAYFSRFVEERLAETFVDVELSAGLLGGLSAPSLFLAFSFTGAFQLILYATVLAVGILVGLELPLLIRILRQNYELKELIARALTFDYAGALVGSLAFSLFLVPRLGLVHTALVCGVLNASVGLLSTWLLRSELPADRLRGTRVRAVLTLLVLVASLAFAERIVKFSETELLGGTIVAAEQSPYQRIVLTEKEGDLRLYLNGHLQFSSRDEHRYHEALVHPAMASAGSRRRVLVGGGGDGLAVREVLKWPEVESVVLVDLDPVMTRLATEHPRLSALNGQALTDGRVRVENADAMRWFAESREVFDVVILDFPDPSNYSLGKLFSDKFYGFARERLAREGAMAVQATSPLFARSAYYCIIHTLEASGFFVRPFRAFIPAFGEWGFALATLRETPIPRELPPAPLRHLDRHALEALFIFAEDLGRVPTRVNRLNNQALVDYYVSGWSRQE
jgi:spermidine synthase